MRRLLPAVLLLALSRVAVGQPETVPPAPEGDAPIEPPPVDQAPAPIVAAPATTPAAPSCAPPGTTIPGLLPCDQTSSVAKVDPTPLLRGEGFRFGSYGRIVAGTDLRGGSPERIKVVAFGPRIVEPSYLELDLSYGFESSRGVKLRPVITLAFDGTLFHDTGDFDARPALRNMYLDVAVNDRLTLWAGSRMYRGDDIYLFDYWPLDDLNTVGAGVVYNAPLATGEHADHMELAAHAGVNRLNNPFQFQEIDVADPEQGATTAVQLDRQRMVLSASASYINNAPPGELAYKAKLHAQVHALPAGLRERTDGSLQALPADWGLLAGGELSIFNLSDNSAYRRHLNFYARYAKGLAAFDELAVPTSFGPDLTTQRANELTAGTSINWDHALGNVMVGALARRFVDADTSTRDTDDGWEYAVDVRPQARLAGDLFAAVDVSYQARFPDGLNPNTLRAEDPAVFQIAPMFVYSPMGPSAYDRPQLRFVYRAAHLNDGARNLYVPEDIRSTRTWVHYLGVQAEWWWNSSRYQ
ncbi:MAG: carbohydrate porin [Kofleriaceae bacterium]|nr:carbohydrate porin [Kofleriaceae bacterium]